MELESIREKEMREKELKSGMTDIHAAILHSQIHYPTEQLECGKKEQQRLSLELKEKDYAVREYEIERRLSAEQYEKQLHIAHSDFKKQVAELTEEHASELKRLEKDGDMPEIGYSENNGATSDDLVNETRFMFENEMSRLENTHKSEKDKLLLSIEDAFHKNQKIEKVLLELQMQKQDWTSERNRLRKTIDSLRKELEKSKKMKPSSPAIIHFHRTSSPPLILLQNLQIRSRLKSF